MVGASVPKSSLVRAWRVGRLAFGLAGSYLGYQIQDRFLAANDRDAKRKAFQENASRQVREELQSLKGPVMKIGQMLSMQSHALPNEIIQELAQLQMRAPAMHPTLSRSQFKASFGKGPEVVFRRFEREPFAAASLGQVHRAITQNGKPVAVKIQYPGIRQAIQSDFKLLRSVSLPGRVTGHVHGPMIDEMERGVLEETDYLAEASNIEYFSKHLAILPFVRVPKVFREFSTDRILTMSLIDGLHLSDFLAKRPQKTLRQLVGKRLLDVFLFQGGWLHALHADPHPGNYLIDETGSIGLVDFGCVKQFTKDFVELGRCFRDRVWKDGDRGFERMVKLTWGNQAAKKNRHARTVMRSAIRFAEMVYRDPESHPTQVEFGDPELINTLTRLWNDSISKKLSNPEFIFYSRAELGLYNILHRLGAKLDTSAAFRTLEDLAGPQPKA